jgi:hypothetical protein
MYAAVTLMGKNLHTVKRNTEMLLVASKEVGLEVTTEITKHVKCVFMFCEHIVSHNCT